MEMDSYLQFILVAITLSGIIIVANVTWWLLTYFYPLDHGIYHPHNSTTIEGTIQSTVNKK